MDIESRLDTYEQQLRQQIQDLERSSKILEQISWIGFVLGVVIIIGLLIGKAIGFCLRVGMLSVLVWGAGLYITHPARASELTDFLGGVERTYDVGCKEGTPSNTSIVIGYDSDPIGGSCNILIGKDAAKGLKEEHHRLVINYGDGTPLLRCDLSNKTCKF